MHKAERRLSTSGWALIAIYALGFAVFEGCGIYLFESDANKYTNREWIFQIWLGGVFAVMSVAWSIPALLIVRDRKRILALSLSFVAVGLTPAFVRVSWWLIAMLFSGHPH